jgi:membrane-associated protease RseP (regulator of RpoE activity)
MFGFASRNSFRRLAWVPLALAAAVLVVWIAGSAVSVAQDHRDDHDHADHDERAYLGVRIEEETDHPEGGARVTRVIEGSPADEAGLEDGDIVIGLDGATIRGPRGLTDRVRSRAPGDRVEVVVIRDGREERFDVELGARSESFHFDFEMPDVEMHMEHLGEMLEDLDIDLEGLDIDLEGLDLNLEDIGERIREGMANVQICEDGDCRHFSWHHRRRPMLGVELTDVTPELREHLGAAPDAGVLVGRIVSDTPAERAGVLVGDLIVSLDGEPIRHAGDLRRALHDKDGTTVTLEIIRDRAPMTLDVTFPEREDEPGAPSNPALREMQRELRRGSEEMTRAMREVQAGQREFQMALRMAMDEARRDEREAMRAAHRGMADARRLLDGELRRTMDEARRARTEWRYELRDLSLL